MNFISSCKCFINPFNHFWHRIDRIKALIRIHFTSTITIASDGTVNVTVAGVTSSAGNIQISRFANNEGLQPIGDNLFIATDASGNATTGTAGDDGRGLVRQGYLESSNVEVVKEMVTMIAAQRAYEVISKSIKTSDEMMRSATNLK